MAVVSEDDEEKTKKLIRRWTQISQRGFWFPLRALRFQTEFDQPPKARRTQRNEEGTKRMNHEGAKGTTYTKVASDVVRRVLGIGRKDEEKHPQISQMGFWFLRGVLGG